LSIILWEKNPALDKRLLELEADGLTQAEIATTLSEEYQMVISRDSVKNRLNRVVRNNLADLPVTELMPYFRKVEGIVKGDEPAPKKLDLKAHLDSLRRGKKRVLDFGDTHNPFEDREKLQKAIDLGRGADLVVVGGDVTDAYSISRFLKEKSVPLEVEVDGLCRFYEYLSALFEGVPVIILQSNHHLRVAKSFVFPQSLEFLARLDLLGELARPFPNIFAWDDWWLQVNDSLFAHGEINSKVPGKPVVETYEWFLHRGRRLGVKFPIRTLIQHHTHKLVVVQEDETKLFEAGCLCQEMPYTRRDPKYMRNQNSGCVILTWQDGESILNQCREYSL
jgi:hypothetical protein